MSNGTTKAKISENYGLTMLFQEIVGQWLIKLEFKHDCDINNYYLGGHENKDKDCYRWNFIGHYLLLQQCMFKLIHITSEESEK